MIKMCFFGMIVIDPYGTLGPVWGTVGGPKLGPNKLTIWENEKWTKLTNDIYFFGLLYNNLGVSVHLGPWVYFRSQEGAKTP